VTSKHLKGVAYQLRAKKALGFKTVMVRRSRQITTEFSSNF
jgi:hypothetical protein